MIALAVALFSLGELPPPAMAARIAPGLDGASELVLIGDTGEPGPIVTRWKVALAAERAPAVLVLGDLVYPQVPPCPSGVPNASAVKVLDEVIRAPFVATGKEVFLVIGNHDVSWDAHDPPRERCLLQRFGRDPQVRLPAAHYAVDLDNAVLVVLNTNALDDAQADFATAIVRASAGKRVIFAGHHVLKTYHDKIDEDRVRPWLAQHHLRPDLWVNGHAHILQLGVYDGIPAVTSGTAAKPRERPACDRAAATGECGDGQLYGSSTPGYAVLRVEPASAGRRLSLVFKDADGKPLWRWSEPAAASVTP